MLDGYKAFNKDLTNRYNEKFEVGKYYSIDGLLKYGNDGNGYHMCKNLVDVFRYYDINECVVGKVLGFGDYIVRDNPNINYYDLYSTESFIIEKILKREEILEYVLNRNIFDVNKYILAGKLNDIEISALINKYQNDLSILYSIMYYQLGYKNIYYSKDESLVNKVKTMYLK